MTFRILIADDEPAARFGIRKALGKIDCTLLEADDGQRALELITVEQPDLVLLDLNMPGLDGQGVLRSLAEDSAGADLGHTEVVVVTAIDAVEVAIECMRLGAVDYLTKPFEVERLRAIARRARERYLLRSEVARLQGRLDGERAFGRLVGTSERMRYLYGRIERAATATLDVLVVGETGTGKELIAREVHQRSDRAGGPFVAVNAAAITDTLAESELFGHVKGAFTGATADKEGVFVRAAGGTLFLDEIGDMPAALQIKLLRALQERQVQPVGATASVDVDVRVISATNQDLADAVGEGQFREDLYYRLRGIQLDVPPLRERPEDIPLLAGYFLERVSRTRGDGASSKRLMPDAFEQLVTHRWPGNVRELEQVVTAAVAMTVGDEIHAGDLDIATRGPTPDGTLEIARFFDLPLTEGKRELVTWYEQRAITAALARTGGNVSAAARELGVHRQSLQQKIAQLGLGGEE